MADGIFEGKRIVVMGLGRFGGGVDAARFACKQGGRVIVTDMQSRESLTESIEKLLGFDVEYRLGGHDVGDFESADVVIVNPAVTAVGNDFLRTSRESGAVVTSQIGLFFQLCAGKIVGITGANGKSTTTAITGHILKAGLDQEGISYSGVRVGGNIGNSAMLEIVEDIGADEVVVLELSSFQAEQLGEVGLVPEVSLLTNLKPNHMDRHGTFEAYCSAKENLFALQDCGADEAGSAKAISIFNSEDEIARGWYEKYKDEQGRRCILYCADDVGERVRSVFGLPGRMNLSNLAGAMAIVKCFGVSDETIAGAMGSFKGLAHRLELVAEVDGVRWYNDSISTTPESSIAALEAFEEGKIIIAGGYDKGLAFREFGKAIAERAKGAILIGATRKKIAEEIAKACGGKYDVEFADSLAEAVDKAASRVRSGDVVLLSPACASYDMFDNFQHRGREFVELVGKLGSGK